MEEDCWGTGGGGQNDVRSEAMKASSIEALSSVVVVVDQRFMVVVGTQ